MHYIAVTMRSLYLECQIWVDRYLLMTGILCRRMLRSNHDILLKYLYNYARCILYFIFANSFGYNLLFYAMLNLETTCQASDIKLP